MLGLPKSTEIAKPLPKKAIYDKFDLKAAQRDRFDADISRLTLVNVVSPATVPGLLPGDAVTAIYVVDVALKHSDYDPKNIALLSNLIPQKMLFILRCDGKVQLAIHHTKLLCGRWMADGEAMLALSGTTTDAVWEGWVRTIGNIEVAEGNSLSEQIAIDEERAKLMHRIVQLEAKARAEKQSHKKVELFQQLQELKKKL